jgi:hypothetical protein
VEIKCKEALHPVDHAQVLSHLRLLGLQVGLPNQLSRRHAKRRDQENCQ